MKNYAYYTKAFKDDLLRNLSPAYKRRRHYPTFLMIFVVLFGIEALVALAGLVSGDTAWGPVLLQGIGCMGACAVAFFLLSYEV